MKIIGKYKFPSNVAGVRKNSEPFSIPEVGATVESEPCPQCGARKLSVWNNKEERGVPGFIEDTFDIGMKCEACGLHDYFHPAKKNIY